MISWFFKKQYGRPDPTAATTAAIPAATNKVTAKASKQTRPAADSGPDGQALLQAALGDDRALLRLAQTAQALTIKLAAVQALSGEDALRQAERDFRSHDRKVHRLAKQRLEAAVLQRQSRAQAQALLARLAAMADDPLLPINHVATLDREWHALPADTLLPEQREQFSSQRVLLDAALQARDNAAQKLQRWTADAKRLLPEWQRAVALAAEQGSAADAEQVAQAIQALRDTRPDVPASAALDAALDQTQQSAAQIQARLIWLDALPAEQANADEVLTAVQAWEALPAPLDGAAAQPLVQRFQAWRGANQPAVAVAPPAAAKAPRRARAEPPSAAQTEQLDTLLQQAEAALAEGQLADMQQHLQAIDSVLDKVHAPALAPAWLARHQALRVEQTSLKGWQQWGGARARDDLAGEAEALALLTRAAAHDLLTALQPDVQREVQPDVQPDVQPEVPTEPPLETAPAVEPSPAEQTKPRLRPARTPKLNLKVHVEQIQTLRARWKELDRLGSPASQTLWLRFDTALRAAYEPVAVQQAAQKAARQDNLLAREALLGVLENLPSPEITPDAASAAPSPVDWRESTLALQRFQLAWRQLGPVEHTVPAGARQALGQRLHRALERVEAPLQAARQAAAHQREALITRAEALLHPGAGNAPVADAPRLVRELQAQWQEQARQLALPRGLENALWARFKTATDAVFVQRDAAFAARDGELVQNLAAREALLTRLTDLNADTAVADIERTLTEVDRAWRQATELPRGTGPALEVRLRAAHAAALALLHGAAQQGWWLQCDRLSARLALCAERETLAADADPGLLDQRWAAAGELPAAWAQALAPRWAKAQPAGPLMEAAFDDVLLQLETALEMPAAPDHHQARRLLKLRTLKDTLEGRTPALTGPAKPADWLAASLRQARLSAAQRARLRAVLAALRAAPPGALGLPMGAV